MTGVILCGGQSTRMGRDKGLLPAGRITWAENMAYLLQPLCEKMVISVNPEQQDYREALKEFRLIKDDNTLEINGPLRGLLSVHLQLPDDDLFILACDLQEMKSMVLESLAEKYREHPGVDAWVFKGPDGSSEPLAAIYSAKGLARIWKLHQNSPLPRHSMKYMLDQLHVWYVAIPPVWMECFTNFNRPDQKGFPANQ